MALYPSLARLIASLTRLPGLGEKSATRLALHFLRSSEEEIQELARSLVQVKEKIRTCSICFNWTDSTPAPCASTRAGKPTCCAWWKGRATYWPWKRAGDSRGNDHVLQGTLSPIDGIGPRELRIRELLDRLEKESISEVVLALNPTTEGEATISYLTEQIKARRPQARLTRIAYGIPMGGDLKYMDNYTIKMSLESRRET